jgi:hypothetical protein
MYSFLLLLNAFLLQGHSHKYYIFRTVLSAIRAMPHTFQFIGSNSGSKRRRPDMTLGTEPNPNAHRIFACVVTAH